MLADGTYTHSYICIYICIYIRVCICGTLLKLRDENMSWYEVNLGNETS